MQHDFKKKNKKGSTKKNKIITGVGLDYVAYGLWRIKFLVLIQIILESASEQFNKKKFLNFKKINTLNKYFFLLWPLDTTWWIIDLNFAGFRQTDPGKPGKPWNLVFFWKISGKTRDIFSTLFMENLEIFFSNGTSSKYEILLAAIPNIQYKPASTLKGHILDFI